MMPAVCTALAWYPVQQSSIHAHHMARFLSWQFLKQEHLSALRAASGKQGSLTARQVLLECLQDSQQQQQQQQDPAGPSDQAPDDQTKRQRQEIVLDLLSYALKQGQAWGFDDERLSVLFGLVKVVHEASVQQRLTIERSFALFKDTLLNHSVHRPPFSCGVFSQSEMQAVLDWMLNTYYRHYKLYQFTFTKRVTLDLTTFQPCSLVEVPPACLPPLAEAQTQQQHQQELDEQQRQLEEQQRREAEEAAAAAAEAAALAVQQEYEASLPEDVKAKVAAALEREVAYLQQKMEQQWRAQQAGLLARLAQLESTAATAAPAAAAAKGS